ncbi:uncharacterized protein LOC129918111 [Episyrphus balteatus]|uniref:uncharacterized protein LOC129918111 n=1 Tax=Episyrphus balteatus TaxID=286459 RepID=UPI0024859E0C|nr:uncharacterized protein LOC129918111 [Episyrphus balteatus]
MKDLKGHTLPIQFGGTEPALILSKNVKGDTMIGGYVGHLFHAFAEKHNARLDSSNTNISLSAYDIHELVLNGTIEMAATGLLLLHDSINWSSYPCTAVDWGVMLPIEPNIPIFKVFAYVFNWETFVLTIVAFITLSISLNVAAQFSKSPRTFGMSDFFFNIDCFRGILGEPFSVSPKATYSTKIIYSLIFMLGIMMATLYDSFLQSFMTNPPKEKVIKSYTDLESTDLKILTFKPDLYESIQKLRPGFVQKYLHVFEAEPDLVEFTKFRDTLNTKYAYTLPDVKWEVYENQQKFFGQRLFRWSAELCFLYNIPVTFSINENSIYKNILNCHILEMRSAGLMNYWKKRAFYELMSIKGIHKFNLTFAPILKPLNVEDLKWIWKTMSKLVVVMVGGIEGLFLKELSSGMKVIEVL